MTEFDDIALSVDDGWPRAAGSSFSDAYAKVLRDRLGDNWTDVFIPLDRNARPLMWSDCLPPQDAPALGYHTTPSIDAALDMTPPRVETPDVQADLVKAYRLLSDAPLRATYPDPRWFRFVAEGFADIVDQDMRLFHEHMQDQIRQAAAEALRQLDEAAATAVRAGCVLCLHEAPTVRMGEVPPLDGDGDGDSDRLSFTVQVRAHMVWPGQQCPYHPTVPHGDPDPHPTALQP